MKKVFGRPRGLLVLVVLAALGMVGLAGCGGSEPSPTVPVETELFFETVELNDRHGNTMEWYGGHEPRVILVTAPQEIDRVEGLIRHETLDQLAQVDFERYFVVAVFRGRKATSGYPTIVEHVTRQGDQIIVYVQFWEPSPYYAVFEAETSPYHLVKVRQDNGVSQETETRLQSRQVTPTPPPF